MAGEVVGSLEGILVVSVEQAVAAPFATSRLADAGARVIKIERQDGDFARRYDDDVHGESAYFVWLNRGKESVVLDIKDKNDADLLARMISAADIFVQNLAPGAAARAGLGAAALRQARPELITCDISGYGEQGPYRDKPAYDLLVQAETGLCSITGGADAPARVGVSVADIAAGMYAHAAIVEALLRRQRTGQGAALQVSLFDAIADWMAVPLLQHDYGGQGPGRVGVRHPSIAPYAAFETKDGEAILFAIQNEREWARFAVAIMGRPEWAEDGLYATNISRVANRDALEGEIRALFAAHGREELTAMLEGQRIAYGILNSVSGLSAHAALSRVTVATPSGPADIPAPPARIDGTVRQPGDVPALGAHTEAVRREFSS